MYHAYDLKRVSKQTGGKKLNSIHMAEFMMSNYLCATHDQCNFFIIKTRLVHTVNKATLINILNSSNSGSKY